MKPKSTFFCQSCGAQSAKWLGKCPSCNEWKKLYTDPYNEFAGSYIGMGNNPIVLGDPDGGAVTPPKGDPHINFKSFDWGKIAKIAKGIGDAIKPYETVFNGTNAFKNSINSIPQKIKNFNPDKAFIAMQGTSNTSYYEGRSGRDNGLEVLDKTSNTFNATRTGAIIGKPMGLMTDLLKSYGDFTDAFYGYKSYKTARNNLRNRAYFAIGGEAIGSGIDRFKSMGKNGKYYLDAYIGWHLDEMKDGLMK